MARMLLIWLLALALPAQGVMAATMVFCGAHHHDPAAVAAVGHEAGATHQPHDLAAQPPDQAADGHAWNAASDDAATADASAQPGMQKCSVCASCCSAAAIHDTVPKLPAVETIAVHFAALAPAIEPFAAVGPDRPPRHVLA